MRFSVRFSVTFSSVYLSKLLKKYRPAQGEQPDKKLKKHEKTFTFQPLHPIAIDFFGGVNASVKADDVTAPTDTKTYPLTISGSGFRIDCTSWADLVAQLKDNDKLKGIFWINIDVWNDVDIASKDGTLTTWNLGSDFTQGPCETLVLRLNGHKVNGNSIQVAKPSFTFRIEDKDYTPVTVSSTAPYTVTNTNSGCLTLTKDVDVYNGATVEMNSGCIVSNKNIPLYAVGDKTGESTVSSKIVINGGYVQGKEGCVGVIGKGATATIDGTAASALPVLVALDNAAVAGNGTNTENKKYGGTTITLGKGIFIGRIQSAGYAACGVYHPQEGTLNIGADAQIIAYSDKAAAAGVVMRGGKLNMTGGTILADGVADATGKVGDSRVVVPSSGIVFDADANYYDRANVKVSVSGGSISGNHSAVGVVNEDNLYTAGQVALKGGNYNSDVAQFAADGFGAVRTYDQTTEKYNYTFAEGRAIAIVGTDGVERYYNDFLYAFNRIYKAGETMKLLKDIDTQDPKSSDGTLTIIQEGVTTIDLNGFTLSTSAKSASVLGISGNAHLVIISSKSTGRVEAPNSKNGLFLYDGEEGEQCGLTIKRGTFTSDVALLERVSTSPKAKINVTVWYGFFDLPKLTVPSTDGLTCSLRGGSYSEDFHTNEGTRIESGYDWSKNGTSWWIQSGVRAYYNGTEKAIDKDEDNSYLIDLDNMNQMVVTNDVKNVNVTVQKTFDTANVWNAFYAPFDLKVTDELLEKFEIAKIWDTELKWDGETPQTTIEFIKLKSGAEIPAFTPCLILAKETGKLDITSEDVTLGNTKATRDAIDCSTVEQKFTFTGVMTKTNIYDKYALADGALVHATNTDAKLSPYKFYMTITDRKSGKKVSEPTLVSIRVIGDETNGISEVNDAANRLGDGKVYNLQGTFVGTSLKNLPAGIYVQNGRKYVVK